MGRDGVSCSYLRLPVLLKVLEQLLHHTFAIHRDESHQIHLGGDGRAHAPGMPPDGWHPLLRTGLIRSLKVVLGVCFPLARWPRIKLYDQPTCSARGRYLRCEALHFCKPRYRMLR